MNINITPAKHFEEPYIGMPVYLDDCNDNEWVPQIGDVLPDIDVSDPELIDRMPEIGDIIPQDCLDASIADCIPATCLESWPLAMTYTPMQQFENLYEPQEGFQRGTIFRGLDLPFIGGQRR